MHGHGDGRRRRTRSVRKRTDATLLCMATAAATCVLVAVAILIAGPSWDTPVLEVPLGAYLMGGLGGLLTTAAIPGWARRVAPRRPGGVIVATVYRLVAATLMGALGYFAVRSAAEGLGTQAGPGALYFVALLAGAAERIVSMALLQGLGLLLPREEVS